MTRTRGGVTGPVPADPARRSKAIALRERGLTFKEIAGILGVTKQRAHQLVQTAEPSIGASRRAARNQRMLALRRRGAAMSTLAREFDMTCTAVRYALRRAQEDACGPQELRTFMPRPLPAITHDAVRPASLCATLDGLAEPGVDARLEMVKDESALAYPVPGSCEHGSVRNGVPSD
jgi:hypothetical protein